MSFVRSQFIFVAYEHARKNDQFAEFHKTYQAHSEKQMQMASNQT